MRKDQCEYKWESPKLIVSGFTFKHECIRYKDHEGRHVCFCGRDHKQETRKEKE